MARKKPEPVPEEPAPKPRKAGRPSFEPRETDRPMIKVMAAAGVEQVRMCAVLGIDLKTLRKHFRRELDVGRDEANAVVVSRLFKMTETNIRAVEFWLTNLGKKEGWAHTQKVDVAADTAKNLGDRLNRAQAKLREKPSRKKG